MDHISKSPSKRDFLMISGCKGPHPKVAIEKCNFCAPKLCEGKLPACVVTCPGSARKFGDPDDPQSEVSRLVTGGTVKSRLEEQGTKPSVFLLELV
jgi:Fe-S-cluster-containing dehydrogenase component